MNDGLEVAVLRGVGRSDPSEPQGAHRERRAERSGERIRELTNRNRIGGIAEQGERANDREALTTNSIVASCSCREVAPTQRMLLARAIEQLS